VQQRTVWDECAEDAQVYYKWLL